MSFQETLLLGFLAGVTILFGLPIGRLRRPAPTLKLLLNAVAIGVLLFLVWDVLTHAWEPIDSALSATHDGTGGWGPVFGYGILFAGGLSVGMLALVAYDRWMASERGKPVEDTPSTGTGAGGSGGVAVLERLAVMSPARRTAVLIAVGIGLHNFAEGLAIGQSSATGEVALATLLVIGFALHNATEGFGIVAPLAGDLDAAGDVRLPSWPFLLTLGLVGGGPTFIGTAVGYNFTSEAVSVVFLTLAAGSIIYVVAQLLGVAAAARRMDLLCYGMLIGLIAGFLTDAIVTAAGA